MDEEKRRGKSLALPGQIDVRDAKLLEARYVHGKTLYEAGKLAGIKGKHKNSIESQASQIIKRHKDMNSEFLLSFSRMGITPDVVTRKIRDGMNATVPHKRKVGKDLEVFQEFPDHATRHKFVDSVLKVTGAHAPQKVEVETKTFEQRLLEITMRSEKQIE